jgi:hypothetical protein
MNSVRSKLVDNAAMAAALLIRDEGNDRQWRVWPDPEPIPTGVIHETGTYLFELRDSDDADTAELRIDDVPLEALRSKDKRKGRWRWSPGFHAGIVEAGLHLPGVGNKRFEVVTDPDLRKLTRDDFDEMTREILEDTFALFALSGFRKGIARGLGGKPPAVARLEFLRSRIDELERVVEAVARNPRRILAAEDTVVPYHSALRATGPEILRSFRSGRVLSGRDGPSSLPPSLKGFLPERIRLNRRRSSLDLPEHRQMASCIHSWASWLTTAGNLLSRHKPGDDEEEHGAAKSWAARCRRLSRRMSRFALLPPFAEAGNAQPRLIISSIFRNDPAYRQFFQLNRDMNLGIAAIFGDFLQMPLARTFDLYELWCFLRLTRAAIDEFGPSGVKVSDLFVSDVAGGVTVAAGAVTVPVGSGWKLCFQKQYQEFWRDPDRLGTFSRIMKPDVAISKDELGDGEPARLIILDAKYRINAGLNDALSSIHTYRDALVQEQKTTKFKGIVTAAYLLSPHLPELDKGIGYQQTPMPGRLFHPEYRRGFRFGAVTLRPGMAAAELTTVIRTIVSDATA